MGKLTKYILILSTVILLYHFGGLIQDTPMSLLLGLLLDPSVLRNSTFITIALVAIATVSGLGVVIGSFIAPRTDLIVKGGMVTYLILIGWDLIALWNVLSLGGEAISIFATFIISPLLIVYVLTVLEWWTGQSS